MATEKPNGELIRLPITHETGTSKKKVMSQFGVNQALSGYVKVTATINGKLIIDNPVITAEDLGVLTKAEVDNLLSSSVGSSSIVQTTGTGTNVVMSQKSVTELVTTLNTAISTNYQNVNDSVIDVETQIKNLKNNKLDKGDVYDKATIEKTFAKTSDFENIRYSKLTPLEFDEDTGYWDAGESILGRVIFLAIDADYGFGSIIIPPSSNFVLLVEIPDANKTMVYKSITLNDKGTGFKIDETLTIVAAS